jgi:hypothetical protein
MIKEAVLQPIDDESFAIGASAIVQKFHLRF